MKAIGNAWLIMAVLFAGFAALPASADEDEQPVHMVVNYGDLDLSVAAGASSLYQRLKRAAWRACDKPEGGFGDPATWLHCYHDTLARAVRDVGSAKVTALYNREHEAKIPPPTTITAKSTK